MSDFPWAEVVGRALQVVGLVVVSVLGVGALGWMLTRGEDDAGSEESEWRSSDEAPKS